MKDQDLSQRDGTSFVNFVGDNSLVIQNVKGNNLLVASEDIRGRQASVHIYSQNFPTGNLNQ